MPSAGRGAGRAGTIGTNRPDGYEVADQIAAALPAGSASERTGAEGLKRLLESRGVMPTDYDDWRKIEETEIARARPGSPARKIRSPRGMAANARALIARLRLPATPFYLAAALAPAATSDRIQAGSGRGVAQPGRALSSGGRGRRFESSLPDHHLPAARADGTAAPR